MKTWVVGLCGLAAMLSGCAFNPDGTATLADAAVANAAPISGGYPEPVGSAATDIAVTHKASWGEPGNPPGLKGPRAVAETDGPYLLDSGDKLRIFVYGQPNLSRGYTVDHSGMITVPLIGEVHARGATTSKLEQTIKARLGSQYVRDPQVTVDILQNRPFFILGEVKAAGQYAYVSGMTVETAVAIAGGYSDRASQQVFRIQRRINGAVEIIEAPSDYIVQAGDTVTVFERYF